MIHTAKQLKDKVKNMSGGNSEVAQALIRTYFMERFLERVSASEYRNIRYTAENWLMDEERTRKFREQEMNNTIVLKNYVCYTCQHVTNISDRR